MLGVIPIPQTLLGDFIPAPMKGVNTRDSVATMDPLDSIFCYNMVPSRYGLRIRKGYREWVTTMTDDVRSVFSYVDQTEAGTNYKLFCATKGGIWPATSSSSSPVKSVTFGTTTGNAGYCHSVLFTTIAAPYLVVVDEVNGYYHYSAGVWTDVTGVTGVDENLFVHVCAWKERLWFVEKDSASAWYLGVGAIDGAATEFNFGTKFRHGGHLIGLWNWTVDGGIGVDDYLVAISSAGDIVVYQGTDPSDAAKFSIRGQWYVGELPTGRRIACSFGGDLFVITANGVLPLSQLISGKDVSQNEIYLTDRIAQVINSEIALTRGSQGWSIVPFPKDNLLIVTAPKRSTQPYYQFVYNLTTRGWGVYRDLPMLCGDVWQSDLYIGGPSGVLYIHDGYLDNEILAGTYTDDINFSVLTSYQALNSPIQNKRVHFIRPTILTESNLSYQAMPRYDYSLEEAQTSYSSVVVDGAVFNTAKFDQSVFGGSLTTVSAIYGGADMGRHVAVYIKGSTSGDTTLVGFDVMYDVGGML